MKRRRRKLGYGTHSQPSPLTQSRTPDRVVDHSCPGETGLSVSAMGQFEMHPKSATTEYKWSDTNTNHATMHIHYDLHRAATNFASAAPSAVMDRLAANAAGKPQSKREDGTGGVHPIRTREGSRPWRSTLQKACGACYTAKVCAIVGLKNRD